MARYKRYAGDPRWITCKYPGQCRKCGGPILRGAQAYRYKDGSLYCQGDQCGRAAEREFAAAAADEAFLTGAYY